jgi:hypothetical protein
MIIRFNRVIGLIGNFVLLLLLILFVTFIAIYYWLLLRVYGCVYWRETVVFSFIITIIIMIIIVIIIITIILSQPTISIVIYVIFVY